MDIDRRCLGVATSNFVGENAFRCASTRSSIVQKISDVAFDLRSATVVREIDFEDDLLADEVVPGTSVVPLSESGMSRNFWGRIKGAKYRFALQDGTWDFS